MEARTAVAGGGLGLLASGLALLLGLCALLACSPEPSAPVRPPAGVTHLRLEGELDIGMLAQLRRGIAAAKEHQQPLVIEIDTPGGELELMWKLSQQIRDASAQGLATAAWVHRHAASAGVLLAISCERVDMSGDASIGSAGSDTAGQLGLRSLIMGKGEKITSAMRADFRAMAEKQRRPAVLAEAMIDSAVAVYQVRVNGALKLISGKEWADLRAHGDPPELVRTIAREGELVNLSAQEAVELGFADAVSDKLSDVAAHLGVPGAAVLELTRSRSDEMVTWLELFSPLLLLAGLAFAYMELKLPGFGLPGVLAIVCFVLLLAGRYLAGLADVPELVAVVVGVVLIGLEIFLFPGSLILGIAGGILLAAGLVLSGLGTGFSWSSAFDREIVLAASFRFVVTASLAIVVMFTLSRFLPKTPVLRRLVLAPGESGADGGAMPESRGRHGELARVGALGQALSALRPVGKVALDADPSVEYEARSSGALLERGARVRVIEVAAARLVVEAIEVGAAGDRGA